MLNTPTEVKSRTTGRDPSSLDGFILDMRHQAIMQQPLEAFGGQKPEVGMQFQAGSEQGKYIVTVTAVGENSVTVDANHPLAGVDLHFEVEVIDVRDASEEELSHGHVHGPGGHHH